MCAWLRGLAHIMRGSSEEAEERGAVIDPARTWHATLLVLEDRRRRADIVRVLINAFFQLY